MKAVSFIIPAYNVELYILHCLDSIYALNLQGYGREVIVVNDGSTDATLSLLASYSANHELTIVNQDNCGLSVARNVGLDNATGDYVCFVDADDVLLNNSLDDILCYISQRIDIIGINIVQRMPDGVVYPYRRYIPAYNKVYRRAEEFMRGRNLMPCAPAYIYRREFLMDRNLRFYPGIFHEDEEFTPRAFALADSFVAIDVSLYERILREDSITTTVDREKQKSKLRDLIFIIQRLKAMNVESMQYKLAWLTTDTLRLLIRQRHEKVFCDEVIKELSSIGVFPLPWLWQWKHILFNLYTRIKFL